MNKSFLWKKHTRYAWGNTTKGEGGSFLPVFQFQPTLILQQHLQNIHLIHLSWHSWYMSNLFKGHSSHRNVGTRKFQGIIQFLIPIVHWTGPRFVSHSDELWNHFTGQSIIISFHWTFVSPRLAIGISPDCRIASFDPALGPRSLDRTGQSF